MEPVEQLTDQEKSLIDAYRNSPQLKVAVDAMVRVVQSGALNEKTPRALEKASDILPESKIAATPTGTLVELPDDRKGFAPHRAYLFSVAPSKGTVLDELKTLLGEAAANQLAKDWEGRCNLDQKLEATEVALFLDSNNKARNRDYADKDAKTTQEEDLKATGHQFAGDLAATLLCARIYRKVQDGVPLSEGEQDLYQKLEKRGLRSRSGALAIVGDGRLRNDGFFGGRNSTDWALGAPLSLESK